MFCDDLSRKEGATDIDVKGPDKISLSDLDQGGRGKYRSVIDQDVDMSQLLEGCRDPGLNTQGVGYIHCNGRRTDVLRSLLCGFNVDVGNNDLRTLINVTTGEGQPNALCGTGN